MRTAVLHWHTSSVGGINTTLQNYRLVAEKRGDTFHVLASDNQRTKKPGLFTMDGEIHGDEARRRVRGGDSFIMIDGLAPHHSSNWALTAEFLNQHYDVIMTSFLCPHPTKAYGDEPAFLPLLKCLVKSMGKPLIGYIHDAYWETYAEFGRQVLPLCDRVLVAQKAYVPPELTGKNVIAAYLPFWPLPVKKAKRQFRRVVWLPQWKAIKGIYKFWEGLGALQHLGLETQLYNNGIEYYNLRKTADWGDLVKYDHFTDSAWKPTGNRNRAEFFGCLPIEDIAQVISEAGFTVDFQGHASKYKAYLNGSYNHTLAESMYYGAVPVVHANCLKSGVPRELVLPIEDLTAYPEAINAYKSERYPRAKARQFVMDNFDAEKQYAKMLRGLRAAR